jgi:alpha-N-arabinofuranosidase
MPETTAIRYRNPIIPGFHPDPSICRVGDEYFLVNSSFEYFPGVPIFHSRDLVHWRQTGYCLTRPSQLPLGNVRPSGGIFAPTIRYHDGTFYMVTTNITSGGNFYVTTRDPFAEWSEPIPLTQGGIDPSLLFDEGKVYLTSTGFAGVPGDPVQKIPSIVQSEVDIATGQLLTEPRPIWSGTGGASPEGPHLYKIDGVYYLMIAEGGTEYGHMETIARSNSPWGPFESCPHNPILTHRSTSHPIQATGHADLVQATDRSWWLVSLGIRPSGYPPVQHLGRETFLAPVTWDSSGWPHVGEGHRIALEMDGPRLTPLIWDPPTIRDNFDAARLAIQWNFLGNPAATTWSLVDRPGWLRLLGNSTRLDQGAGVAFIGRRQEHFNCEVETMLDYAPIREGEEAGLTVWKNPHHHYDLFVSRDDDARRIGVRGRIGGISAVLASQPLPEGPIILLVRADRYNYEFTFRSPEADERTLATLQTRYLASEVAGGFTGVYFALYASGNGQESSRPAYFDWFDYRSLDVQGGLGVETAVRELLANEDARAILERHLPGFTSLEIPEWTANMPLLDMLTMQPDRFPTAKLRTIRDDLRNLVAQGPLKER